MIMENDVETKGVIKLRDRREVGEEPEKHKGDMVRCRPAAQNTRSKKRINSAEVTGT